MSAIVWNCSGSAVRSSVVRLVTSARAARLATLAMIAVPSAPKIASNVLFRPDARPASLGWTPARVAIEKLVAAAPSPTPKTTSAGSIRPR